MPKCALLAPQKTFSGGFQEALSVWQKTGNTSQVPLGGHLRCRKATCMWLPCTVTSGPVDTSWDPHYIKSVGPELVNKEFQLVQHLFAWQTLPLAPGALCGQECWELWVGLHSTVMSEELCFSSISLTGIQRHIIPSQGVPNNIRSFFHPFWQTFHPY